MSWWIVPAVAAAVLLGLTLFVAVGTAGVIYAMTKGPRDTAHAFAEAVYEDDMRGAHALLVKHLRREMSVDELRESMKEMPLRKARDLSFHGFYLIDNDICLEGTVAGEEVGFLLVKEGSDWRVDTAVPGEICSE